MEEIQLYVFDLDGTLLDTAHDFFYAVNKLRKLNGLDPSDFLQVRCRVSQGAASLARYALDIDENQIELDLTISPWLYVVTGLGSLMLAIGKRRSEIKNLNPSSNYNQRIVLTKYSVPFLDSILNIVSSATLICYTLYTFNSESNSNVPENNSMMITIPFVAFGIIRYTYLLYHDNKGETPEKILLSDFPIIINIILWVIAGSTILMLGKI